MMFAVYSTITVTVLQCMRYILCAISDFGPKIGAPFLRPGDTRTYQSPCAQIGAYFILTMWAVVTSRRK